MTDKKWPDEPFRAKHDASGTPVKVTPVETDEPHWFKTDADKRQMLMDRLVTKPSHPSLLSATFLVDVACGLLEKVDRLEARIAAMEAKDG